MSTLGPALRTGLLGAVLVLAAAVLDAEPLYVPGFTFVSVAAIATALVLLGARGLTVTRTVGATRVVEGDPLEVVVEVSAGRAVLPPGRVHDDLLPGPAPLAAGRRTTRVRADVQFSRRGRWTLDPSRVVVRDPLGLASRVVRATGSQEVLVLPRVEPVTLVATGGDGSGLGLSRRTRAALADVRLEGIGPLRTGTPASRIYWPSIARLAEPQERRLHDDGDRLPLIVLDPRTATDDDPSQATADVDAAVRAAASLVVHLARAGGCDVLVPGDRRPTRVEPTLGGWARLHVRLALVEAGDAPALAAVQARLGPIIYVSARRRRRAPRALRNAPGGGRVLVVPGGMEGRRATFSVAGCTGHELTEARMASAG